jgi:hypothetical protein
MNEAGRLLIRKILIIVGLIMLTISIAIGVCIIIFSFKFMAGTWLTLGKYILAMIGLGLAGAIIAIIGIFIIYLSIDTSDIEAANKKGK